MCQNALHDKYVENFSHKIHIQIATFDLMAVIWFAVCKIFYKIYHMSNTIIISHSNNFTEIDFTLRYTIFKNLKII